MVVPRDAISLRDLTPSPAEAVRRWGGAVRHLSLSSAAEQIRDRMSRWNERTLLQQARSGREICYTEDQSPLVTVRITTYGRPDLLIRRTLPSVLAQSYRNLEILIVGDCTDEATSHQLEKIADPRIRYVNLPYRPPYPARDADRAKVYGYQALNLSLDLARGAWIAPCDDDDELTHDHVERLLRHAIDHRAELVHSNTAICLDEDVVAVIGRAEPTQGQVSHGCLMYSSALRLFRYNGFAWQLRRPLDWDLVLRMKRAGVRMAYMDDVSYIYHPSEASLPEWRRQAVKVRPDLAGRWPEAAAAPRFSRIFPLRR